MLSQHALISEGFLPDGLVRKAIDRIDIPEAFIYSEEFESFFFNSSEYLTHEISHLRIENYHSCHESLQSEEKIETTFIV
jgi:hypothetical protein